MGRPALRRGVDTERVRLLDGLGGALEAPNLAEVRDLAAERVGDVARVLGGGLGRDRGRRRRRRAPDEGEEREAGEPARTERETHGAPIVTADALAINALVHDRRFSAPRYNAERAEQPEK